MNDARHTRAPSQQGLIEDTANRRAQLTTDMEPHDGQTEGEPSGRWAMAKTMRLGTGGAWVPFGEPFRIWDPWDDGGYDELETGDECKVEYVRGAKRWEVYDAPCAG